MENHIEKLKELVGKCRVGMLGTHEGDVMRFRPMSHVDIDDEGKIWFFVSLDAEKTEQIENDPHVHLTYTNESENMYLNVDGLAYLNTDKTKMKELFNVFVKAWFPEGLKDPNLALLVVHPQEVEYWISDSNKIMTYFKMLSAAIAGTTPPRGKHRTITL